jgi:hypothetical protein
MGAAKFARADGYFGSQYPANLEKYALLALFKNYLKIYDLWELWSSFVIVQVHASSFFLKAQEAEQKWIFKKKNEKNRPFCTERCFFLI